MIKLITESAADLTPTQILKFNIQVIPMHISINGKSYLDNDGLRPQKIFSEVESYGNYPLTAAPSISEYKKYFSQPGEKIFIGVSSKLSSAFNNATIAAEELNDENIHLIDARSISSGVGRLVLKAGFLIQNNLSAIEITEEIHKSVDLGRGLILLDTLDYLYHGGRVSSIKRWIGSILQIRPILFVKRNGTLDVIRNVHGSRKKCLDLLVNEMTKEKNNIDPDMIILTYIDCKEDAEYLRDLIIDLIPGCNLITSEVGCVLASHSGPNAIGIAYSLLDNIKESNEIS